MKDKEISISKDVIGSKCHILNKEQMRKETYYLSHEFSPVVIQDSKKKLIPNPCFFFLYFLNKIFFILNNKVIFRLYPILRRKIIDDKLTT